MRLDPPRIFMFHELRGNLNSPACFDVFQQYGPGDFGDDFTGVEQVKQDHILTLECQRPNAFDHFCRVTIEIRYNDN